MVIIKRQTSQLIKDEELQPRAFAGLVEALESSDATTRRLAARELAAFPAASAILVARLKHESNASVSDALITALTRLGGKEAVAGLVECLRSEDAALRNEAIEAMKEMPDEVAPIMDTLLVDADPDVRIFAVNILESLRHPGVETWLVKVIASDPHVNVCAAAADLLSEVGSEMARGALEQLSLRFPNEPYIAFVIDVALKRHDED